MSRILARLTFAAPAALSWVISERSASAQHHLVQPLLAQTGTAKTAIGWLIVLLCIGLGLLVVLRPSGRKSSK